MKPSIMNSLIDYCNKSYVTESIETMNELHPTDRAALLEEFDRKPEMRFGDNLIAACSFVKRKGGGEVDVYSVSEFSYELSIRNRKNSTMRV